MSTIETPAGWIETICASGCGKTFRCGASANPVEAGCWCATYAPVEISHQNPGCVCPDCLAQRRCAGDSLVTAR